MPDVTRRSLRRLALAAAGLLAVAAIPAHAGGPEPPLAERLVAELSSESASVREHAAGRLAALADLDAGLLAEALRTAPARARPQILLVAAQRGAAAVIPAAAELAAARDAVSAEAALRTLVSLGPDGVAAAEAALADAADGGVSARTRSARLLHLRALDAQRRVERDVLSRWRRKGGSYRGRYAPLAAHGWDAQPVLLAMLLDVPLEDHLVVVPPSGDADLDAARRMSALSEIASSRRRGYRTFDALPATIDQDELFELANQALADVADLELMGDVLEGVHAGLAAAADTGFFVLRPFEDGFANDIECILAARGRPALLDERRRRLQADLQRSRRLLPTPEARQFVAQKIDRVAAVLHQLGRYAEAAARYEEASDIVEEMTGRVPSVTAYNRACALARDGRKEDALEILAKALDPERSSGSEDLTREWVTEDGDLASLHDDPRFAKIVEARFGRE